MDIHEIMKNGTAEDLKKYLQETIKNKIKERQRMEKKTKYVTKKQLKEKGIDLSEFRNFSRSGSIIGMRKQYYGKDALLIIHGSYIYHVTEEIFNLF